jgi:hypothetical protein
MCPLVLLICHLGVFWDRKFGAEKLDPLKLPGLRMNCDGLAAHLRRA